MLGLLLHEIIIIILLLLLLLLLLRWHYSPMRTFASLMDSSRPALFFLPLFPIKHSSVVT